ncbi:transposase [Spirosoma foliorum]|uniref:Transposase n=1 Tax=Spirosoma foliorum TaxID=2710596 RepID=A0A7G5H6K9_9BACT|nr:transposase [Spirosoma foliorum]QMW06751.1 transposase [Spirosoma foliorum]
MVRPVSLLEEVDRQLLTHICQDPTINQVYELAKEFAVMVRSHHVEALDDWLFRCKTSSAALLQQFGLRLHQDYAAVQAALATEWSNGQTEGQVTRVKLIKRQMYGRAKLDLLRQRVCTETEPHKVRKSQFIGRRSGCQLYQISLALIYMLVQRPNCTSSDRELASLRME